MLGKVGRSVKISADSGPLSAQSPIAAPGPNILLWGAVLALGLLAVAVFIEVGHNIMRGRRSRKERWANFLRFMGGKGLSKSEAQAMEQMARRNRPDRPEDIITSRRLFDQCVSKEMLRLKKIARDEEAYRKYVHDFAELRRKLSLEVVPPGQALESSRGINPGVRLDVEAKLTDRNLKFKSTVLQVDDLEFVIGMSSQSMSMTTFQPGMTFQISFWRDNDARYNFSTTINRVELSPEPKIYLQHSARLERLQTRKYFRIITLRPIRFAPVSAQQAGKTKEGADLDALGELDACEGEVSTISGGGLSIISDKQVLVDQLVILKLDLNTAEPLPALLARVVGVSSAGGGRFLTRCAFWEIEEDTRDRIIGFVNAQQRPTFE